MKTSAICVAAVLLMTSGAMCGSKVQLRQNYLPEVGPDGGTSVREYVYVPYSSAHFEDGRITATWGEDVEVVDVMIAANWEFASDYAPGMSIPLTLDPAQRRYDFVGKFIDTETGEEFLGLTPILCGDQLESLELGGAASGIIDLSLADECLRVSEPGDDATCRSSATECHLSVECEGDECETCGDVDTACCTSKKVILLTTPTGGTVLTTILQKKVENCPTEEKKKDTH